MSKKQKPDPAAHLPSKTEDASKANNRTVTPLLNDASGAVTAFVHVPHIITENGTSRVVNIQVALTGVSDEEFKAAAALVRGEADKLAKAK